MTLISCYLQVGVNGENIRGQRRIFVKKEREKKLKNTGRVAST
jgi:hypothetical protein